jgi:hypothetical protein
MKVNTKRDGGGCHRHYRKITSLLPGGRGKRRTERIKKGIKMSIYRISLKGIQSPAHTYKGKNYVYNAVVECDDNGNIIRGYYETAERPLCPGCGQSGKCCCDTFYISQVEVNLAEVFEVEVAQVHLACMLPAGGNYSKVKYCLNH